MPGTWRGLGKLVQGTFALVSSAPGPGLGIRTLISDMAPARGEPSVKLGQGRQGVRRLQDGELNHLRRRKTLNPQNTRKLMGTPHGTDSGVAGSPRRERPPQLDRSKTASRRSTLWHSWEEGQA